MTREVSWRRFGPDALVLEFGNDAEWSAIERARRAVTDMPALKEATSGFTTLLCEFEPGGIVDPAATARELLKTLTPVAKELPEPRVHEIPVKYDGPDLKRVAEHAGISVEEVVSRHSAPEYLVRILGFMPGFPYLEGLDPKLATPRLATPRKKISMGAVGIGGNQTGIYPIPSPGGWNLIGHTGARLFDPLREGTEETILLRAGDRLRFVPV